MKKYFWPVVLYIGVIGIVFGRALYPGATEMIWGDDIHRQYYFNRQFFNNFLSQGIWPWWNPYVFSGAPFIANPVVNIWYPATWLFVLLPLNVAYSWHIAIHIFWAMMGMYCALREMSKVKGQMSNVGAWLAGLVFGLSGFFTARIWAGHVDVIAAASWLPWVFGAFWYLISAHPTKLRHGVILSAIVLAMQILAGYQTMAFFTLEAVFIATSLLSYFERSWRPLVRAGLAVLLGLGLAAIQIIPAQEFFRAGIRTFSFPYRWNAYGSLTLESLKQFLNPFFFGDQVTYSGPPPNFAEHAFFVGRVGMLVMLAVALFRLPKVHRSLRSPMLLAFGCIALFGLWVSLGPNAPIDLQYILWKLVPMYHYLRIPPRHLILVAFGLSGLVGIAMNFLISKSHILNSKQYQSINIQNSKQFRLFGFGNLDLFRILSLGFRIFVFVVLLGIATEMMLYARHFIVLKPIPETRHDTELIRILKSDTEPYRVLTNFGAWVPPRDSFDLNAGMHYGVFNATGYDPSILRSYYEYIDMSNGNPPGASILSHDIQVPYLNVYGNALDALNIKYILHPRGYDPLAGASGQAASRFKLIREDALRDYRLYENTSVLPRFYFVGETAINPESVQPFTLKKEGSVRIVKYAPNEIILSVQSLGPGYLMSSEIYYPGWEGFVDDKKVDVIKANRTFRTLFVPAGNHTVVYHFSPRIFLLGGLVTIVSLVLCLALFFSDIILFRFSK